MAQAYLPRQSVPEPGPEPGLGAAQQLPEAVEQGFVAVLSALTGSRVSCAPKLLQARGLPHCLMDKTWAACLQDSIKTSKEWFMACVAHVDGLAAKMAAHQQTLPDYEKQLHVIYLANDVLLKRWAQQSFLQGAQSRVAAQRRQLPCLCDMLDLALQRIVHSSPVHSAAHFTHTCKSGTAR